MVNEACVAHNVGGAEPLQSGHSDPTSCQAAGSVCIGSDPVRLTPIPTADPRIWSRQITRRIVVFCTACFRTGRQIRRRHRRLSGGRVPGASILEGRGTDGREDGISAAARCCARLPPRASHPCKLQSAIKDQPQARPQRARDGDQRQPPNHRAASGQDAATCIAPRALVGRRARSAVGDRHVES